MTKLPVFRTIGQAMAVFGLHFGKLFKWTLIPLALGGGVLGAALGLAAWQGALGGSILNPWMAPVFVAGLFALLTFVPLAVRINQLAALGRVEDAGYVEMIFAPRSLRYLGYACVVTLIMGLGLLLSALPLGLVHSKAIPGNPGLALALSVFLALVFLTLTAPLNLVMPAVAVEREPSLGKAFDLGAHCKLRLFLAIALSTVFFSVLTQGVELLVRAMGGRQDGALSTLVALPLQVLLTFFSYVTSVAVPAVAYRFLSGLPEPGSAQAQDALTQPGPTAEALGQSTGDPAPQGQAPGGSGEPAAVHGAPEAQESGPATPPAAPTQVQAQAPAAVQTQPEAQAVTGDPGGSEGQAAAPAPAQVQAVAGDQGVSGVPAAVQTLAEEPVASSAPPARQTEAPAPVGPSGEAPPVASAEQGDPAASAPVREQAGGRQSMDRVTAAVTAAVERAPSGPEPGPEPGAEPPRRK